MKTGETITYRGYPITKHLVDDFVVEIGLNTLKDAQEWIDELLALDKLEEVTNERGRG